jgi:hypothetical protein
VQFPQDLWHVIATQTLSVAEVICLQNIEQRMAAIGVYGLEQILAGAQALFLDHAQGYELYVVHNVYRVSAYYLKYRCPSTGRVYISGVPPFVGRDGSALRAIKWKFGLEELAGSELFTAES